MRLILRLSLHSKPRVALCLIVAAVLTTIGIRVIGTRSATATSEEPLDDTNVHFLFPSKKGATVMDVRNASKKDIDKDPKLQPSGATAVSVRNASRKGIDTKPQPHDPSGISTFKRSNKKDPDAKQPPSSAKVWNVHNGLTKAVTFSRPKSIPSGARLQTPSSKNASLNSLTKHKSIKSAVKANSKASSTDQYRLDIPSTNSRTKDNTSQEHRMSAVCADTVCGEQFLLNFTIGPNQPLIPAIRHILWKSENISSYFLRQLQTWQRIHPNWTFVLWRDSDLEPFVRKHFPGKIHQKFASLPTTGMESIERIDMFRYILMYKFGGVYADLDYTLVSSLDSYRRYPAVVTREPEAHAAQVFGLASWPLPILASPAFLMAAPGHPFFFFALHQLVDRRASSIMTFAGPLGLGSMLSAYFQVHMSMVHPAEFVYIPPSYSFYPYEGNRLGTAGHIYLKKRKNILRKSCKNASDSTVPQVQQFCRDVFNLDPITDKTQPVIAIHDMQKKQSVYENARGTEFVVDLQNAKLHVENLKLGDCL